MRTTLLTFLVAALILPAAQARPRKAKKAKPAAAVSEQVCPVPMDNDGVAVIGDRVITVGEVDRYSQGQVRKAIADLNELLRQATEQYLAEELLNARTKELGITPEEYVTKELDTRAPKPDEAKVQAYLEEQVTEETTEEERQQMADDYRKYLEFQLRTDAVQGLIDDLLAEGDARVLLTKKLVNIPIDDRPILGTPGAPITIVEFADFECPYCAKVVPTIDAVLEAYPGKIQLVFWHFPLPFHPNAALAHNAAACAQDQDAFWPMHHHLFEHQSGLASLDWSVVASTLGIDGAELQTCMESEATTARVAADKEKATELGVDGTPTFFINGEKVGGAQSIDAFKAIIDRHLSELSE